MIHSKAMIRFSNYRQCSCCSFQSSSMALSFHGQNSWAVTRKRSKAEERREEVGEAMEPVKVCSVCHRSKTPMWRNGPDGPKSLCNACGIKYRKRRRREEMEETASKKMGIIRSKNNVSSTAMDSAAAAMSAELKRRQREKQEKMLMLLLRERSQRAKIWRRRWSSEGLDGGGYTKEVAEAALLLLSLSSGIYIRS